MLVVYCTLSSTARTDINKNAQKHVN